MAGNSRSYALDISEHLFRLTTECLRLHSNDTKQYQTLESLCNERVLATPSLDEHNPETIRQHLSAVPTDGDIRVNLTITRSSAENLGEIRHRLDASLGCELTLGETLSIMLFHYVVGQKAARVLKRIGLDDLEDSEARPAKEADTAANIVRIK